MLEVDGFFERQAFGFGPPISNVVAGVVGFPGLTSVNASSKPAFLKTLSNIVTFFLKFLFSAGKTNEQLVTIENPCTIVSRPTAKFAVLLINDNVLDVVRGLGAAVSRKQKTGKKEQGKFHG